MSGALSPTHWVIIILVFAVLFGARKLPEAARGMGQAMRIFKAEASELQNDRRGVGDAAGTQHPGAATPGTAQPPTHGITPPPASSPLPPRPDQPAD